MLPQMLQLIHSHPVTLKKSNLITTLKGPLLYIPSASEPADIYEPSKLSQPLNSAGQFGSLLIVFARPQDWDNAPASFCYTQVFLCQFPSAGTLLLDGTLN